MIDLNNHLLGDDGSGIGIERALACCEAAWRDGVEEIVVTCRLQGHSEMQAEALIQAFENRLAALRQAVESSLVLNDQRSASRPFNQLSLAGGYEWTITADLPERIHRFPVSPGINRTGYLLLSLPSLKSEPETSRVIDQLRADGFTPIMAHPECSRALRRDQSLIRRLTEAGALIQLDATSLLGGYGKAVEAFALELLKSNQVRFMATRTDHRSRREVRLSEACQRAARVIGRQAAHALVTVNPQAVLAQGEVIPTPTRQQPWPALETAASS